MPEIEWPPYHSLIDQVQLWPAIQRLSKRPGAIEQVALLADPVEAEAASSWLVTAATGLSGLGWTSEVTDVGSMHGIRLQARH